MSQRRAVFLDRDGVLNQAILRNGKPHPPATVEEVVIPPDAAAACRALRAAGFVLAGVTNQPDVARGTTERATVEAINLLVRTALELDVMETCYHDDADGCSCRKPMPGLLVQAAAELQIDLARSFLIGDRWKDIEAGRRAGCRTVLVGDGYLEAEATAPDWLAGSLGEAVAWILTQVKNEDAQ